MQKYVFIPLTICVLLSACVHKDAFDPVASNNLYQCDQSQQMILSLADYGDIASLRFNGKSVSLPRVKKGEDIFANSFYRLYIKDDYATLEREGAPLLTGCKNTQL